MIPLYLKSMPTFFINKPMNLKRINIGFKDIMEKRTHTQHDHSPLLAFIVKSLVV
jgi:hypothetical protein